ncbi:hypothetical protein NHX12_030217 [Muraenolepis orangiensis]|uniref:Uncharacterized protein n=1 Tax=Muraenolepis orangiensis TaxID=630683 RepID=A0A9Q0EDH5_9TELE|nr:hypothetical protein NHX12_030217 [Muraenolepis orangiensis]
MAEIHLPLTVELCRLVSCGRRCHPATLPPCHHCTGGGSDADVRRVPSPPRPLSPSGSLAVGPSSNRHVSGEAAVLTR